MAAIVIDKGKSQMGEKDVVKPNNPKPVTVVMVENIAAKSGLPAVIAKDGGDWRIKGKTNLGAQILE